MKILIHRIKGKSGRLFLRKIKNTGLSDYSTNFYFIILIAFCLLSPSYSGSVFSGIPLNTKLEFFVFLFLISFLLGLILIKRLNLSLNRKIILYSIPIMLIIILKIILFSQTADHPEGFKACYRALINELPEGECEFSFNYFLKSKRDFTRYDEIIDFDSDWRLGFWNESRFHVWQWVEGNQIRERNPFEVTWRGNILFPNDSEAELQIRYTGEGNIQLGNNIIPLPTVYQSKNTFLVDMNELLSKDLTKKNDELILPIKIYYRFQDNSKVGMDKNTLGPNSNISVKLITGNEGINFLRPYYVKDFKVIILSLFLDSMIALFILVLIVSHLILLYKESKFLFIVYVLGGIVALINLIFQFSTNFINSAFKTNIFFFIVVTIVYFTRKNKRVLYFFISFIFLTQLFVHINEDLGRVLYRGPGDDPMTYESQSRSIGKAENIASFFRGEEDIFYYQPFFRYYLAFNHILLGDGNNSVSLFNKFLFLFTIPFIFLFFSQRLRFIPALVFSLTFMNILYEWGFLYLYFGLSEYPAWLFLIMAVYLLFYNKSHLGYFVGFVLLGLAAITRIDFLPGILYFIFVFHIYYLLSRLNIYRQKVWLKRYRIIIISFLIIIVIYSLVPLHNYFFGKEWVLTTSSTTINLKLPPSKLLRVFSDERIQQYVLNRFELMFYLDWKSFSDKSFYSLQNFRFFANLFFFLLMISFLFNIVRLVKIIGSSKRRFNLKKEIILNLLFILIPISFLFIHLFYVIKVYYPRHIVIAHMMIYLFSIYSSSRLINWCYGKLERVFVFLRSKFTSLLGLINNI